MSTSQIIIVVILTMVGSAVHGAVGIGLGLIAAPALVAIDPAFTPGPLLLGAQIVGARHIVAEHKHADLDTLRRGLLGILPGIAIAIALLELVSDRTLAIIIGLLTAMAALMLLSGIHFVRTPRSEVVAGFACALASLTAVLPGPPLVCVYSDMPPRQMRPNASMLIMVIAVVGFASLLLTGNFGRAEVELLLWILPGVIAGLVLSRWLRPWVDGRAWFRTAILVMAMIGGLALVARQL